MIAFGYILTFVGILSASYGAGDTLTMALNRKPVLARLRRNDRLMLVGAVIAALGVVLVLKGHYIGTLVFV